MYLWGLLFLLIPILVHLFNFRKAKKVYFTRVDLLKEIKTEKKSFSSLKKRLILFSRLMAILFFVLAVSSPYLSEVDINDKIKKATFLYLDNSFSMQAKSGSSRLLDLAKKDIEKSYTDFKDVSQIYLFSNDNFSLIESENELVIGLSKINYSYKTYSTLKAKSLVSSLANKNSVSEFNTIIFSDFNESSIENDSLFSDISMSKFVYKSDNNNNISIDSLWFDKVNVSTNRFTLKYKLTNFGNDNIEYNEIIKFSDKIQQSLTREIFSKKDTVYKIELSIPSSKKAWGEITIDDNDIYYDNKFSFAIDFSSKSKVLFVGNKFNAKLNFILNDDFLELENSSNSNFKLLNPKDYDFLIYTINPNFTKDELELVKSYINTGKGILIIPNSNISISAFNKFINELGVGRVVSYSPDKSFLSNINYSNIFFDDIFNSKVENFDFPLIAGSYNVRVPKSQNLLSFDNGKPLLLQKENQNIFLFTSPIFEGVEAFIKYNLALPVLYKIVTGHLQSNLYYKVGIESVIHLNNSDVKLKDGEEFIDIKSHIQNNFELPVIDKSGVFELFSGNEKIKSIAYNYSRTESESHKIKEVSNSNIQKYDQLKKQNNVIYLWKWCLTFTLGFLIFEMSLISFLKD